MILILYFMEESKLKKVLFFKLLLLGLILNLFLSQSANAISLNVAKDANITLNGIFYSGGWASAHAGIKETIVDGIFLPRGQEWDIGTVYWNYNYGNTPETRQNIQIDLGNTYIIDSFIVQTDNNDTYKLYYKNLDTNNWDLAWDIPAPGGWGLQIRPNVSSDTQRYYLSFAIRTNALKIEGGTTDQWYSVSEVQAFGIPTPEPSSMILSFMSLAGLLGLKRRRHTA
jgi:hypothetical protein